MISGKAWPLRLCLLFGALQYSPFAGASANNTHPGALPVSQTLPDPDWQSKFARAYEQGSYSEAARLGALGLVHQPSDHALRLAVANSLAWSGRLDAAIDQYERLLNTAVDVAARVGIADIARWRGRPHDAERGYRAALDREPNNQAAQKGLRLARRSLNGLLDKKIQFITDSTGIQRLESSSEYSKYSDDRSLRFGMGYALGRDLGVSSANKYAALGGFIQALSWPTEPRLDLGVADGFNRNRLYGMVSLDVVPSMLGLRFGVTNWGRSALTTAAQASHLFARTVQGYTNLDLGWSQLNVQLNAFDTSDRNFVWDAQATMTPAWQVLPGGLKWYTGVSLKRAERADSRYWSPTATYALATLGLKRAWYFDQGDIAVTLQSGLKLTAAARNSVALTANGSYWISDRTALGFSLYASSAPRDTDYRARGITFQIQRAW